MAGWEGPGSGRQNDQRFRVMDISNLESDPEPLARWPSDFGLSYDNDQWYVSNWGYNTHGHGRDHNSVHWAPIHVLEFGGTVYRGLAPDTDYNYGWRTDVSGISLGGRHRRLTPWLGSQDWAYGAGEVEWMAVGKRWRNDPDGSYNPSNYTNKTVAVVEGGRHGIRGFSEQLGDKYFVLSDQRRSGLAIYQIPDDRLALHAANPDLDAAEANGNADLADIPVMQEIGSNVTEDFGGYWPEFYARDGQLYAVAGNSNSIQVSRLTHPTDPSLDFTDPVLIRDYRPMKDGVELGFTNASYPKFQDNLFMADGLVINMDKLISGDPDPIEIVLETPEGRQMSQWCMPLGNLIVSGGYGEQSGGIFIHTRQQAPDTTRPKVAFHIPADGRTHYSPHMPISVIIHEELDSETLHNGTNFSLRKVIDNAPSGDPVDCFAHFGSNNVLMITPKAPLEEDSTYQMTFQEANGLRDISGNLIEPYSFRFSTGGALSIANPAPDVSEITNSTQKDQLSGGQLEVSYSFTAEDDDAMEYRFDPGDGSGYGPWLSLGTGLQTGQVNHTYTENGRFVARVQVRDTNPNYRTVTASNLLIYNPPTGTLPTESSPIILAADQRVWAVNPDANTVSVYNPADQLMLEYSVGKDPRGIAEDVNERLWVTCFDSDEVWVLNPDGSLHERIALPYGDAPFAVCPSPGGQTLYVSAYGSGGLYVMDADTPDTDTFVPLGPTARAIAVTGDGTKVYVTRFITEEVNGTVWRINTSNNSVREIDLYYIATPDGNNSGAGIPNYLAGIAISPYGDYAVVTGKKDNVFRGPLFGTNDLTHENTVRAMMMVIDVSADRSAYDSYSRQAVYDLDNADSPTGIRFSPDGQAMLVAVQGNNQIMVLDADTVGQDIAATLVPLRSSTSDSNLEGGRAPQGLVLDPQNGRVFSQNFMSRSITVFDAAPFFDDGEYNMLREREVSKVAVDGLSPEIRLGKEIFYNAIDPRMGAESYMSCATCHVDGGHDGRVWDFSDTGEGLRRTTDLRGRSGMAHGNVHWSGNFDEIQDFEIVMRDRFLGEGFVPDAATDGTPATDHAGLSPELDALAAYVASLDVESAPKSPLRNDDGSYTDAAFAGKQHFQSLDCISCHSGSGYTNSVQGSLLDVGSRSTLSGQRLGGELTGIDTPTLIGLHATGRYLHTGETDRLEDALQYVGGTVYDATDAVFIDGSEDQDSVTIVAKDPSKGGGRNSSAELVANLGGTIVEITDAESGIEPNGLRFTVPNPGSPGSGKLRVRARLSSGSGFIVNHNGVAVGEASQGSEKLFEFRYMNRTAGEWLEYNVTWNSGDNVIDIALPKGNSQRLRVEAIMAVFPDAIARMEATHGRAISELTETERSELFDFINQLDGHNGPPRVNAGADTAMTLPVNTIGLTGFAEDIEDDLLSYQWTGPDDVQFSGADAAATEARLLTPGDFMLTLSVNDGSGWTAVDTVTVSQGSGLSTATPGFSETNGVVSIEAENGQLGSNWQISSSVDASGSSVIETSGVNRTSGSLSGAQPEADIASYPFIISQAGTYSFYFRILSPDDGDNSFFWRLNGGTWTIQNGSASADWFAGANTAGSLSSGEHTLEIAYREDGSLLDKFVIQQTGLPAPAADGPQETTQPGGRLFTDFQADRFPGNNDPEVIGQLSDPDDDGIPNAIEYYYDLDPNQADPANLSMQPTFIPTPTGMRWEMAIPRLDAFSDVQATPMISYDLEEWFVPVIRPDQASTDASGRLTLSGEDEAGQMFMRLNLSIPDEGIAEAVADQ